MNCMLKVSKQTQLQIQIQTQTQTQTQLQTQLQIPNSNFQPIIEFKITFKKRPYLKQLN